MAELIIILAIILVGGTLAPLWVVVVGRTLSSASFNAKVIDRICAGMSTVVAAEFNAGLAPTTTQKTLSAAQQFSFGFLGRQCAKVVDKSLNDGRLFELLLQILFPIQAGVQIGVEILAS